MPSGEKISLITTQTAGEYLSPNTPVEKPSFIFEAECFVADIPAGTTAEEVIQKLGPSVVEGKEYGFDKWPLEVVGSFTIDATPRHVWSDMK